MASKRTCDVQIEHNELREAQYVVHISGTPPKDVCWECLGRWVHQELSRINAQHRRDKDAEAQVYSVNRQFPQHARG